MDGVSTDTSDSTTKGPGEAGAAVGPGSSAVSTTDGRIPGERGRATRRRLLEATVELLVATPWRMVKVIDIARCAGTSPATFYQYFENVEAAIGVLAEEMVEEATDLAMLADGDWTEDASWETALALTEAFLSYWETNRAVFRVLDLVTAEGDAHLRGVRVKALNAVTVGLARAITQYAPAGPVSLDAATGSPAGSDPMAVAGTLVAMLASVSSHRYGFEFWGIRTRDLVDCQTRLVHWAVTGRPGPEGVVGRDPRSKALPGPRTGPVLGGAVAAHRSARGRPD